MARVAGAGDRPILTIDLDGVICRPPFGRNLGIHRSFLDPTEPPRPSRVPPRWFSQRADHLRFDFRRPLSETRGALESLGRHRTLVLLTGRRSSPARWLRRHGLAELLDDVLFNDTQMSSPQFKMDAIARLRAAEHIDDDGRTAQLLAQRSDAVMYLRDWPRNRGLPFHARVRRVSDLQELATVLREASVDESSD